jgi:hypothetical protein
MFEMFADRLVGLPEEAIDVAQQVLLRLKRSAEMEVRPQRGESSGHA